MRIVTLQWAGGVFCTLAATVMLALPGMPIRSAWAVSPAWIAFALLGGGGGLLGAAVFPLPAALRAGIHVLAGAAMLSLAQSFATRGAGVTLVNLACVGVAVILAPALCRGRGGVPACGGTPDLLTVALAAASALSGAVLVLSPARFSELPYDVPAVARLGFAIAFLTTSAGLLLQTRPVLRQRAANVLHLTAAGTFLAFMLLSPLPGHHGIRVAYYLVFGIALALSPWAELSLARAQGSSLRVRFIVALGAAMTLAMVAPVAIVGDWAENEARRQAMETQTTAASWAAESLQGTVTDLEGAMKTLAAVPHLLEMPAPARDGLLRASAGSFPEATVFALLDADGRPVARSDGHPLFAGSAAIFAALRDRRAPVVQLGIGQVLGKPVLQMATPIFGPGGSVAGAVFVGVETSRLFSTLVRAAGVVASTAYLVDDRGRAIASWDSALKPFADLSARRPVAAMLRESRSTARALVYSAAEGDRLAAYARLPRQHWGVVVERRASDAFATAQSGRELSFLVHAAMMLVAVVAGTVAAAGVARPLEALAREAGNLGEGGAPGSLPGSSVPEIARLSSAFERMHDRLAKRTAEQEAAEESLRRHARDLARSNAELEQFAYVASHDLQEPLRTVKSYLELVAKRYAGRLDADADQFIAYAVDGAARMQHLISDLLTYSRVDTSSETMAPVSCEGVLAHALAHLKVAVDECGAVITHDPLPTVVGDAGQLRQLFENLVGNAIKFRNSAPPRVHVSAGRTNDEWRITVQDNGIGIAPEHAERIFAMFQRLHTRTEYPGTGIGLSICKKIVERHGGRISVESEEGRGATFVFTLPACDAKEPAYA